MTNTSRSIVEYFAEHEKYRCGYCGSSDTNYSHGMWAHVMNVQDYQELIDRGWRRSGKYVYKPTMDQTCCPQYSIRQEALKFKVSKSQKKVIKQVHQFLNNGTHRGVKLLSPQRTTFKHSGKEVHLVSNNTEFTNSQELSAPAVTIREDKSKIPTPSTSNITTENCDPVNPPGKHGSEISDSIKMSKKQQPRPGVGPDPNKPNCKKAKLMRLERHQRKLVDRGMPPEKVLDTNSKPDGSKTLEELFENIAEDPKHKLEIKLVRSCHRSDEFEQSFKESFEVYQKYQMAVHKDSPEDCDEEGFVRFLVDSPLQPLYHEGGSSFGFGSFHQQYWLDGKLIAVGVIDILPHCVSSVYFYYDPDFSFLTLGTYSALREILFSRYVHSVEPSVEYYYMGFFIHSCPKMRYKGNYFPSYLLCPEAYTWHIMEDCTQKLDTNKYCRFSQTDEEDAQADIDLSYVLVLHRRQAMPYMMYHALNKEAEDEEEVLQYAKFVGKRCAERILLYRH